MGNMEGKLSCDLWFSLADVKVILDQLSESSEKYRVRKKSFP